jgi:hypothetical protein
MERAGCPRKNRAGVSAAQGDDGVDPVEEDGVNPLGSLSRDVDPDLAQDGDGLSSNRCRLRARRPDSDSLREKGTGDPFGHLAASRVGDAKEEKPFHDVSSTPPAQGLSPLEQSDDE